MPIFIFAFTTNQNAISITNELQRPTPNRILLSTCIAIVLALCLYLLTGIGGYSTYGDLVQSDILKSYPSDETLPIIARGAIAFVVTVCFPMQVRGVSAHLRASPRISAHLHASPRISTHLPISLAFAHTMHPPCRSIRGAIRSCHSSQSSPRDHASSPSEG